MTSRYFVPTRPRLFGHRGAAAHFPENTLPSFLAAREAGVAYLELDVWATCDGEVVIHHDESALRQCGMDRRISDCSLSELKGFDAGFGFTSGEGDHPFRGRGIAIPTLREFFAAFPDALCNIEIKPADPPIESLVIDVVRAAGREDSVLLAAENDDVMRRLRPLCDEIPTSFSREEAAAFFQWIAEDCRGNYRPPAPAIQIPESFGDRTLITPATIEAAHSVDLEMHVWTVNDAEDMERLLAWGIDGLMSDKPELLLEVTARIG